jgi:hypothetical protein
MNKKILIYILSVVATLLGSLLLYCVVLLVVNGNTDEAMVDIEEFVNLPIIEDIEPFVVETRSIQKLDQKQEAFSISVGSEEGGSASLLSCWDYLEEGSNNHSDSLNSSFYVYKLSPVDVNFSSMDDRNESYDVYDKEVGRWYRERVWNIACGYSVNDLMNMSFGMWKLLDLVGDTELYDLVRDADSNWIRTIPLAGMSKPMKDALASASGSTELKVRPVDSQSYSDEYDIVFSVLSLSVDLEEGLPERMFMNYVFLIKAGRGKDIVSSDSEDVNFICIDDYCAVLEI